MTEQERQDARDETPDLVPGLPSDPGSAALSADEHVGHEGQVEVAELAAELRRVLLVSSRILRSHTASDDVSASQYSVLAYLQRSGASTPGTIADFEHVSPPVMTRMLGRLEREGLVHRAAHPADGRQVRVTLTEAGERVVLKGRAERDAWLRTRIEAAGPQEQQTLRDATALLRRTLISRPD
ncbi:MarR family winged helix-turn-helix transcriptional regulator [Brachybacterium sp. FME24]|uniref:MarR family winged helix-turn-helix transcriptional regulator n=1 Tax=Brachybacterium sp. FME24 TaxID=2742605 RepID=UPI0027151B32|nr:MarR family transcriptional regulator [Brachybacterium sp. FME24]